MSHGHGFGRGVGRVRRNPRAEQGGQPPEGNLLLWSEQFDRTVWKKVNGATISANLMEAPGGSLLADEVHYTTSASSVYQDSTTASVATVTAPLTLVEDEWVRGSVTSDGFTFSVYARPAAFYGGLNLYLVISTAVSGLIRVQVADIDENNITAYLWGAQLEAGAVATAYVKREGT